MKTKYIVILLFINSLFCHSQEKTTLPVAQLRKSLKLAVSDTSKVSLLTEIGTFYYEQSPEIQHPHAIDSAQVYAAASRKLAESIPYKSGMAKSYLLESRILLRLQKPEEAEQWARKSLATFTDINSKPGMAKAYLVLANFDNSGDLSNPILNAQKALQLYKESNNRKGQADALLALGYLLMSSDKMVEGRKQLLDALELYKSVGYKDIVRLLSLIAINYSQTGMRTESVAYGLEAVRLIDERNNATPEAAEAINYVAIIYHALHEEQKSFEYLLKADKIAVKYNNLALVVMLETNIVQMLMKFKRYKEALVYLKRLQANDNDPKKPNLMLIQRSILVYTALKDFKSAKKYVDLAMAISAKYPPNAPEQYMLYPGIVKYHMEAGEYDIARKYVAVYKAMAEKSKNTVRLADIHKILFQLDSTQQRFNDAIKELKIAKTYEYAILNTKKDKAFQELQVKYDSDKKDKDLLLKEKNNKLLRKQGELQATKLEQANLIKNLSFAGILALVIILSLVYRSFYNKQKTNRLLQLQKEQIDEKNIVLQKLADEREWLLREIHHRVKNNLQIVMSLLSTQSHYLTDKAAMLAISSSQHRIHSMSLIHKKLYQSDNLVAIHMPTYINELVEYFRISFDTGQRIRFHMEIEEINLDIAQAVPIGLILNEAITNAIKHAFPNDTDGFINIAMQQTDTNHIAMTISDNGVGLQTALLEETLGMKLIKGLSGDIDGTLETTSSNGFTVKVTFPFEENKLKAQPKTA